MDSLQAFSQSLLIAGYWLESYTRSSRPDQSHRLTPSWSSPSVRPSTSTDNQTVPLQSVAVAYRKLAKAFCEKHASPAAVKVEAKIALNEVKKGWVELAEGVKLLQ